jgi:hypothetical protein
MAAFGFVGNGRTLGYCGQGGANYPLCDTSVKILNTFWLLVLCLARGPRHGQVVESGGVFRSSNLGGNR